MRDKITLFEMPNRDERGVSPVIGVILMVAITVILAAVIASFVLGFGDTVSQNVQAGANIQATEGGTDGKVTVTWISEGTAESLEVNVSDTANVDVTSNPADTLTSVGESTTINEDVSPAQETTFTVNVIGVGSDGTRTVIASEEVTI